MKMILRAVQKNLLPAIRLHIALIDIWQLRQSIASFERQCLNIIFSLNGEIQNREEQQLKAVVWPYSGWD